MELNSKNRTQESGRSILFITMMISIIIVVGFSIQSCKKANKQETQGQVFRYMDQITALGPIYEDASTQIDLLPHSTTDSNKYSTIEKLDYRIIPMLEEYQKRANEIQLPDIEEVQLVHKYLLSTVECRLNIERKRSKSLRNNDPQLIGEMVDWSEKEKIAHKKFYAALQVLIEKYKEE